MNLTIEKYCSLCGKETEAIINEDGQSECAECGSLV
jgi:DNA-directed RNA polymerase subunit RPC12/RpoP